MIIQFVFPQFTDRMHAKPSKNMRYKLWPLTCLQHLEYITFVYLLYQENFLYVLLS